MTRPFAVAALLLASALAVLGFRLVELQQRLTADDQEIQELGHRADALKQQTDAQLALFECMAQRKVFVEREGIAWGQEQFGFAMQDCERELDGGPR